MESRIRICDARAEKVSELEEALSLPHFIAHILVCRGIDTPCAASVFLNPELDELWGNPYDIDGLADVVATLDAAIEAHKHIVVFGDFDLDGISATTVMTRGIRALGGKATPFIPKRFEEGYGITDKAIERLIALQPDLVVTVDCGISCGAEVEKLQSMGIQVAITDHHEGAEDIPKNVPLCDPKLEKGSADSILAGVGVALKVIQALGSKRGYPYLWKSYTDLATLGTVADLMPMVRENRALVADGLEKINDKPRPCIAALISSTSMQAKDITASNLSFSLIPRLNAAGRMGNAELALDLLMCDSYEKACELAEKLEEINTLRRNIESDLSIVAREQAKETFGGERVLIVAGKDWHEGVKGIVASRLVNEFGVPALLFTIDGDEARGSGRSIGDVNLFKAIESASHLLTRFGGHGAAVGVTLPIDNLPLLHDHLCKYMSDIPEEKFSSELVIDAQVTLEDMTMQNVELLEKLAPFGQENPVPKFVVRGVSLVDKKPVGADRTHLSCQISDGRKKIQAIMFHCKTIDSLIDSDEILDVIFTITIDEWRGVRKLKAIIEDVVSFDLACDSLSVPSEDMLSGEDVRSHSASDDKKLADEGLRAYWEKLARTNPRELESEIISAIIGENIPHPTQRNLIDQLERGNSVLGVMATGRGKSLVFQVHAAKIALRDGKQSLFVYPLRALMADQAYHLSTQFATFGIKCAILNGETSQTDRDRIYKELKAGDVDIILTTPEFLAFHADTIAKNSDIGFMVVDEAHHIGQAKAGNRLSYRDLGCVANTLGNPVVLAVSATVSDEVAQDIYDTLPVQERVVDNTARTNLHIDDARNVENKMDYLAHIVAMGGKSVIYVNSREQSISVARALRARIPKLAPRIGFYNAGLDRHERKRVETLFREGAIQVLVSTSAFGEGIDIPDIRHVVLYHMPFSDIEFNQMSGRAGRDGQDSWVHLLYNKKDADINNSILAEISPDRDTLAKLYVELKKLQAANLNRPFTIDIPSLVELTSNDKYRISPSICHCGFSIFSELGLIEIQKTVRSNITSGISVSLENTHSVDGDINTTEVVEVHVIENAPKVELSDSIRFQEGIDEVESFRDFCKWAISCSREALKEQITHPIIPMDDASDIELM